jgi:signal transduction histidine kinase
MTSQPPETPSGAGARLRDEQIAALVWREIEGTSRLVARARVVVTTVVVAFIFAILAWEPPPWRLWPILLVVALVAAVVVRDFFWLRRAAVTPQHLHYLLTPVIILQTVIILLTGGAESPFLVLYVAMGMAPAVVLGRLRPYLLWAAAPLGLLWFFSIGAATGFLPDLSPAPLASATNYAANHLYTYTQATVFTGASLVGGAVILTVRRAVENSVRRVADTRSELMDSMRERNRELMALSGELAHELKNPLASIQGLSTLIDRRLPAGSKEKEHMAVLIAEVKRMGATLDEFLNFSRPVLGLAARAIEPRRLLAEVVLLHEGLARQRGVRLTLGGGDEAGDRIVCDPRKVKQVLVNLVQNALDASPVAGAVLTHVERGEGGRVSFVIEDDGPGIAAEVRARLFQPGATTKDDGSGLGLTIARAIAEQHGGSLCLDDRPDGGCRAILTLPPRPRDSGAREGRPSDPAVSAPTEETP